MAWETAASSSTVSRIGLYMVDTLVPAGGRGSYKVVASIQVRIAVRRKLC
jgi:hypothetical protein